MKNNLFVLCCTLFICLSPLTKNVAESLHICPTHWWVGMDNPKLEILVHQKDIANYKPRLMKYSGVKLVETIRTENPNYVFLELIIQKNAPAGTLKFEFEGANTTPFVVTYTLKARKGYDKNRIQGLTSADFVYLLMPDRFSNGDKTNDVVKGMNDVRCNRDSGFVRHGGDLQGVINHLDYIKDLGVTALWLCLY